MARSRTELPPKLVSQLPAWIPVDRAVPLGNHGGFSGALLWRISATDQPTVCLRCWPQDTSTERVQWVHKALIRLQQAEIDYVPAPYPMNNGETFACVDGRIWEVSKWLDGLADYRCHPNANRLQAAAVAVARIHHAWNAEPDARRLGTVPAVNRRWQRIAHLQSGGLSRIRQAYEHACRHPNKGISPLSDSTFLHSAQQVLDQAEAHLPTLARILVPMHRIELPLQLCLRDIWHDHILFRGDSVVGVVDFDAVGQDSIASDLARLVGSLAGDHLDDWQTAVAAYRSRAPLSELELELATKIDHVNVVLNPLQWLDWLFVDRRSFGDWGRVHNRFHQLAQRLANHEFPAAF